MATLDLSTVNQYPYIKRVSITDTAQKILLPVTATKITFGSVQSLYFTNIGDDGDDFGGTITDFGFVPANNLFTLHLETGRQSNRDILIGVQSGTGDLCLIIEKDR